MFESYARDGYLFIEQLFSTEEIEGLRGATAAVIEQRSERTILEADSSTVRSVFAIHDHDPSFGILARHPRLVETSRRLLGADVYVYQSKLNTKAVFGGDLWPWHQDYIFWRNEDGMPAPRALTAAVFLDDVTEINGPMSIIPGSHLGGVIEHDVYKGKPPGYDQGPAWISNVVAKLTYTIEKQAFISLAIANGVVTPKGKAGSVLFFDCNTAHASPVNLSPYARTLALFTYNVVDNAPPADTLHRPEFLVSRDARPIAQVADDALRPTRRVPA